MGRYSVLLGQEENKPLQPHGASVKVEHEKPSGPLDHPVHSAPVRPNGRTPERVNGRRIITRNSFEIYEDQMDLLRDKAFQEKRQGKIGSMSEVFSTDWSFGVGQDKRCLGDRA